MRGKRVETPRRLVSARNVVRKCESDKTDALNSHPLDESIEVDEKAFSFFGDGRVIAFGFFETSGGTFFGFWLRCY